MLVVKSMSSFVMLAAFGVAAFLVAWVVNAVVGLLSGERPRDTANLWFDIFFRFFAILELELIGRILSYLGLTGWPRKAVFFIGMVCEWSAFYCSWSGHVMMRAIHTPTHIPLNSNEPIPT